MYNYNIKIKAEQSLLFGSEGYPRERVLEEFPLYLSTFFNNLKDLANQGIVEVQLVQEKEKITIDNTRPHTERVYDGKKKVEEPVIEKEEPIIKKDKPPAPVQQEEVRDTRIEGKHYGDEELLEDADSLEEEEKLF